MRPSIYLQLPWVFFPPLFLLAQALLIFSLISLLCFCCILFITIWFGITLLKFCDFHPKIRQDSFLYFVTGRASPDLPLRSVLVKIIELRCVVQSSGGGMATNPQLPQEHDGYHPAEGQQGGCRGQAGPGVPVRQGQHGWRAVPQEDWPQDLQELQGPVDCAWEDVQWLQCWWDVSGYSPSFGWRISM